MEKEIYNMDLQPLFNRVLAKRAELVKKPTDSKLFIPDESQVEALTGKGVQRANEGTIVAIGTSTDASVKIGDTVYWGRYVGDRAAEITRNGETYVILNDEDILVRVQDGTEDKV